MLNELLSVKEVIKKIPLDWVKGGLLEVESHISAVLLHSLNASMVLMSGDGGDEGWCCIQSDDP